MLSVFMSYSHEDRSKAQWLKKYLNKSGADVWLDEADLRIGALLEKEIPGAIKQSNFLIVLLSPHSISSAWVQKEIAFATIEEAQRGSVFLLPVKIADCELPASRQKLFLSLRQRWKEKIINTWLTFRAKPEPQTRLADKVCADLSSSRKFASELVRIARTIGVTPAEWPDLERMYCGRDWQTILMVQTFADRPEWGGPSYHCVNPPRRLKRILKVFGGYKHPVLEPEASRHIESAIININKLDPDILGLGGMGETATKIESALRRLPFTGKIAYWGGNAGLDACDFLRSYEVESMLH